MQFFPLYLFFSCSLSLFSLHPATAFACELSGAVPWEEITSSGFDPSITSPSLPLLQHVPCGLRDRGTQIHPHPPIPHPPKAISSLKTTFNSHPRFIWKPHANGSCSIQHGLGGRGLVPRRDFWWTCGRTVCKIEIPIRKNIACQAVDIAFKWVFLNGHYNEICVTVLLRFAL